MSRALLAALLVLATGCGGGVQAGSQKDPPGKVSLEAICPGAHQVYDALVASNPASQVEFVDHLTSLRKVGDAQAQHALDPVLTAATVLASAGRGPDFSSAQDGMYQAVRGLDADCRKAGSYILH